LTICGGFMPAQLAGVLVGKTATAPRFMVSELQKQDARTNWVEKRYVRDGKVWTSGTLLNGLDLMREFMLEYWPELTRITIPLAGLPVRDVDYPDTDGRSLPS
jgi:putative intracellular protease/amidase